jgi:hypothetical protein
MQVIGALLPQGPYDIEFIDIITQGLQNKPVFWRARRRKAERSGELARAEASGYA